MGRKTLLGWACVVVLAAATVPAYANGLVVNKARATFRITRNGLPNHHIRVRGIVTATTPLDAFDPARHGVRVQLGEFVALTHTPGDDATRFKHRKGVWRLRTKINGVKTKLTLDSRSGLLSVDVRKTNASALRDAGPEYVECTLEVGTSIVGDALVFDERGRSGNVKWVSLPQGVVLTPPGLPPIGERKPQGSLVYEILASGEQSQILQPGIQIARTDTEWQALYDLGLFPGFHKRPDVDFTQEMVIGVFTGLVSSVHQQQIDLVNITDTVEQLHVSWRSRFGCFQFACTGGLNQTECPDFAPFLFVRVRKVDSLGVSNRAPSVYDDCP